MITAKYFKEEEFKRCDPPCSLQDMAQDTMDMLDRAREIAGVPFTITCAYRSKNHEIKSGRSGGSAHTLGKAVDIRTASSSQRFAVMRGLIMAGFTRIGEGKTFIHADNSHRHDQKVMWDYK